MESRSRTSEKDYLIIQLDCFLSVRRKKICESSPRSSPVQSSSFVKASTETYYGCPQCGHKKVDKLDDIKSFRGNRDRKASDTSFMKKEHEQV